MLPNSQSPNRQALRRLLRNKPAVFGIIVIVLATLTAIFAYGLAPDSTPNADDQISELTLQDPGFQVQLLAVRKNRSFESVAWWKHLWQGTPNIYKLIPINRYEFKDDRLVAEVFRGIDRQGQLVPGIEKEWNLADILFPVIGEASLEGQTIAYQDLSGATQQANIADLQQRIEKEQINKRRFLLGTDKYGRCMLSRLLLGVRISLLVGLIAVLISLSIGLLLGAIAGYFGGKVDDLIMLFINTVWSIPTLLLVFAIVLALGRGVSNIFLAVGLTMWVEVARIVRGQVMGLKEIQFVEAAQSMGFSHWRIISRHILPNVLGPVMVVAAANFATAILVEAGLSYLGFGIQPPTPSWGTMLNENYGLAIGGKPFLALIPALAIMLMVLAFNLLGNGFRDALDVKTKTS